MRHDDARCGNDPLDGLGERGENRSRRGEQPQGISDAGAEQAPHGLAKDEDQGHQQAGRDKCAG